MNSQIRVVNGSEVNKPVVSTLACASVNTWSPTPAECFSDWPGWVHEPSERKQNPSNQDPRFLICAVD